MLIESIRPVDDMGTSYLGGQGQSPCFARFLVLVEGWLGLRAECSEGRM